MYSLLIRIHTLEAVNQAADTALSLSVGTAVDPV